jgi:hypothetical protein
MRTDAGYIVLACGADKYLQLAINFALSAKLNDPDHPVCLVHDESIRIGSGEKRAFDAFSVLPPAPGYGGCLNKLRLYETSPFAKTMYVDSDCFIVKNDMARHWSKFSGCPFNAAGSTRTKGNWHKLDIAAVCQEIGAAYIVDMNSGVFYFERGPQAQDFFACVNHLYATKRNALASLHRDGRGDRIQVEDEPFIGAAMGMKAITPFDYTAEEGALMITTVWARRLRCDPVARDSSLQKANSYIISPRIWAGSWTTHSPSIAHFVALRPAALYARVANQLRALFDFPPYH